MIRIHCSCCGKFAEMEARHLSVLISTLLGIDKEQAEAILTEMSVVCDECSDKYGGAYNNA